MRLLLQRYMAFHFILPFLFSTLFFVTFLLTFQLFRITSLFINKGVQITVALELIFHMCMSFIPLAIPLSLFFSIIYSIRKFSQDSEYIVMRSFGFSRFKILSPYLILSFSIGLFVVSLNYTVIPNAQRNFKSIFASLSSKSMLADIQSEQFYTEIPRIILFAKKVSEGGKLLENVFIRMEKDDVTNKGEEQIIFAKSGQLIRPEYKKDNWSLKFILSDGNITKTNQQQKTIEKIFFKRYEFPIDLSALKGALNTKESMRSTPELFQLIKTQQPKTPQEQEENIRIRLEYWERISVLFLCLSFSILGMALGVQKGRGSNLGQDFLILFSLLLYYATYFGLVGLARKGSIIPELASLGPNILFLGWSLFLYRRLEWNN